MHELHHDPKQWKQPERFIPDRFDSSSDWYKTPNGTARNPLTFGPFLGGKRICIGKTFAEVAIRFTVPILFYHFEFEFLDKNQLINKPKINAASTKSPVIPVKLNNRRIVRK